MSASYGTLLLMRFFVFGYFYSERSYVTRRETGKLVLFDDTIIYIYDKTKHLLFWSFLYMFYLSTYTLEDWKYQGYNYLDTLLLMICWVCSDAFFFVIHSAMHTRLMYRWFHKLHHRISKPTENTDNETFTLIDGVMHMLESFSALFLIGRFVEINPTIHNLALSQWFIVGQIQHGGKDIPQNQIPMLKQLRWCFGLRNSLALQHDKHHTLNNCNFSMTGLFDLAFGTLNDVPLPPCEDK